MLIGYYQNGIRFNKSVLYHINYMFKRFTYTVYDKLSLKVRRLYDYHRNNLNKDFNFENPTLISWNL